MINFFKGKKTVAEAVKEHIVNPRHEKIKKEYKEKFGTDADQEDIEEIKNSDSSQLEEESYEEVESKKSEFDKNIEKFLNKTSEEQELIIMGMIQSFGPRLGNINPLGILPNIYKSIRKGGLTEDQHKRFYVFLKRILDEFPETGYTGKREDVEKLIRDADLKWREEVKNEKVDDDEKEKDKKKLAVEEIIIDLSKSLNTEVKDLLPNIVNAVTEGGVSEELHKWLLSNLTGIRDSMLSDQGTDQFSDDDIEDYKKLIGVSDVKFKNRADREGRGPHYEVTSRIHTIAQRLREDSYSIFPNILSRLNDLTENQIRSLSTSLDDMGTRLARGTASDELKKEIVDFDTNFDASTESEEVEENDSEAKMQERERINELMKVDRSLEFSELDSQVLTHSEIADQLINMGRVSIVLHFLEKFKGIDHNDIIERTIAKRPDTVMALIDDVFLHHHWGTEKKLVGVNSDSVLDKIIDAGGYAVNQLLSSQFEELEGVNQTEVLKRIMSKGDINLIEENLINVREFISPSMMEDLVDAGYAEKLARASYGEVDLPASLVRKMVRDQAVVEAFIENNLSSISQKPWFDIVIKEIPQYTSTVDMFFNQYGRSENSEWKKEMLVVETLEKITQEIPQRISTADSFLHYYKRKDTAWRDEPWAIEALSEAENLSNRAKQEAVERRDRILEDDQVFTLSRKDFEEHFPSHEKERGAIRQGNFGDCYLVAFIDTFRRWPHFEMVCRSSVKVTQDGWEVKIPPMGEHGKTITVDWFEAQNVDKDGLYPLQGATGYQVLETAYIKAAFGTLDRESAAGGSIKSALEYFGPDLFTIDDSVKAEDFFTMFDKNLYITQVSRIRFSEDKHIMVRSVDMDKKRRERDVGLVSGHAYSVFDVDREEEIVYMINPWNTDILLQVNFDQFEEYFNDISMCRVDNTTLLQNTKNLEKEV